MRNLREWLKENYIEIIIFVFCAAISLSLAFNKSIGIDEQFSIDWSAWDISGFWNRIQLDVCPVYLILLRPVMLMTEKSLLAGKLFSWCSFFICLLVGCRFIREECGKVSCVAYCLMLVGTPLILEKSVEVRMYAIAYAFIIASAVLSYRVICDDTKMRHWIGFVIFGLMAAYTHYFTLLSLVLIYVELIIWFIINKNIKKIVYIFACSAMMVLGYGPWLAVIFRQTNSETTSWIPAVDSRLAPIRDLFDTHGVQIKFYMMYLVIALTAIAIAIFVAKKDEKAFWAIGCILIPWIIMVFGEVFQIYARPILVDRYMSIPFCLFILGIAYLTKYMKKYFAIILCVVFLGSCIVAYPGLHEELYITNVESDIY